ncbi:hypothetical protein [Halobaculum sp. D14]|uniref:hypothetical protein n=1 Tax=Halobaculum sp. D14 TaxID=3421642 RepID=UPI003EC15256
MKAILQGEFHISSSDKESLLDHIDEDVDALFVEQREDSVSPNEWSFGYLSFLVSTLIFYWFQAFFDNGSRIEDEVDVPVFDEIDTPLPELYSRFPLSWIVAAGLFTAGFFLYGIFIPKMAIPFLSAPSTGDFIYTVVMKLVMVVGAPVLFSGILIYFEEQNMGSRDEDMANSIIDISEKKGFDTVIVSCGNMHLRRLPGLLEDAGWDVEIHESNHSRASRLWR